MASILGPDPSFSAEALLEESGWFRLLSEAGQDAVRQSVREVAISAGEALSHQGDVPHAWCGVLEGLIKLSSVNAEGRAVTFAGLAPAGWFGEATLLREAPFAVDALALRPSRVLMMPAHVFFDLLQEELAFSRFIMRLLSERLHWFMGHCYANRTHDTQARVARAVVGLFHPAACRSSFTELRISQEEVANIAGVSRQSCNSALKHLCDAGVVEIDYGTMRLLDLAHLRKLVDG